MLLVLLLLLLFLAASKELTSVRCDLIITAAFTDDVTCALVRPSSLWWKKCLAASRDDMDDEVVQDFFWCSVVKA